MHTPDTNHRYAGFRESIKLVSQQKGAAADLAEDAVSAAQISLDYDTSALPKFGEAGAHTIEDAGAPVQRARVILDYIRRVF